MNDGRIPLRCPSCGSAKRIERLAHEVGATEVVMNCSDCGSGDAAEAFYGHRERGLLSYADWMDSQGLPP